MMNNILENIKIMINDGHIAEAKEALDRIIEQNNEYADRAYYLKGNACRKLGDWQGALNNYQEAININPESPLSGSHKHQSGKSGKGRQSHNDGYPEFL